ncbi:hypothetical protein QC762_0083530 [Podospora pseudocomata]|uniref:Uncharacterized protein n=1 Tax=Podospora pseudocomata TaxID=2093779 RepID=A0ABR0GCD9_9PEZI|nr:hypothetical protein QC762_0083530 [Podospora pseudocomata]
MFQIPARVPGRKIAKAKGPHCVGVEDIVHQPGVGSVAPLGNTKEDDYYRNDSLKYCRHEQKKKKKKKKKKIGILAEKSRIYIGQWWPVRRCIHSHGPGEVLGGATNWESNQQSNKAGRSW